MTDYRRLILSIVALIIFGSLTTTTTGQNNDQTNLERIQRATVYIMQTQQIGDRSVITCVGSGTIVDRQGLIAANAHNTVPNPDCPGERLVIALSVRLDEPPIPTYYAEVVQANEGLDLALLQITQELNGRVVEPETLSLPFVELADSSQVELDNTIRVVGYPGVHDDPVSQVRGTVTGFVAEPSGGTRTWIKTDASIPGTMTGGGVYNRQGRLIAVPTTMPVVPLIPDATCQLLEDTNGDGTINNDDRCVPIGGSINALRPSSFVRPLLRSASLGLQVDKVTQTNLDFDPEGDPAFSRLFISPSVVNGMPTTVAQSLPTGTTSLYLFFNYVNMTPNTIYELRVTINERPSPTFSLAPVRWSGGQNGLWYIGSSGQTWPNGTYEFTLFINGIASGTTQIQIGIPPSGAPAFSNIAFGIKDEESGQLYGRNNVLPSGSIANAQFIHRNMQEGMPWTAVWYYNGEVRQQFDYTWQADGLDTETISIRNADGNVPLPPGSYRLELYINERLSTLSNFVIAGAQEGAFPRVFTETRFVNADSAEDAVEGEGATTFSSTTNNIYALFDWERLAPGTLWTMRWSVDGEVFYEETVPWDNVETGQDFIARLSADGEIPDGTYRMELLLNDTLLGEAEAEVGIGQLPIDELDRASGVQLNGRIIDAETRNGIPGVTVILIGEEFSVADFNWNADQIYALATTDRNGSFQFDRPLQFDVPYSVVINAEGYLPVNQDGVIVDEETPNPVEIVLPLTRD